ncbi:hypothetical protein L2Y96_12630 [Luteibacter aegosomaticola]|uniref:hypothetical protein n=1 Tax=Luteibacter aegosomaticola TaxID=2911538 RepID=UPI001FF9151C|nr:hypothetical protein [Luteibacter aegosomaticola]UPG88265.1 hypothetical protein L2Y96_12630 [Luteibacter aegosomaticola]
MTTARPRPPQGLLPDAVQLNRRGNLRQLLQQLQGDGIESFPLIDRLLGLEGGSTEVIQRGAYITDAMAREIEWSMNLPEGWLDRGPREPEI